MNNLPHKIFTASISMRTVGNTLRDILLQYVLLKRLSQLAISTASTAAHNIRSASGIDTTASLADENTSRFE
jgi:hypothetical protein